MLRSHLFWKVYAGYVLLILATTATVGVLIHRQAAADMKAAIRAELDSEASLLAALARPALEGGLPAPLQAQLREVGRRSDVRLTVISLDGVVLADSAEDPAQMENHLRRPEVQQSLKEGLGVAERFSRTVGARLLYVARTVPATGEPLGFVRTSLPLVQIESRLARLRGVIGLGAGLAALLGLGLGWFVTRRYTTPLISMTRLAEEIARGGRGQMAVRGTDDEIDRLARSFNRMAGELRERIDNLSSEHNKVLAILGSMVEGVVAVDEEERVVHLNQVARTLLKVPAGTLAGRRIWELTRMVEVPQILEQARREAAPVTREVVLPADAARTVGATIDLRASPLRDAEGRLSGAVAVLHDVSELRRLEAVRRDFVANVSHELKTPLTAIRGFVETLLSEEGVDAATRKRFLERIHGQSERLSQLVADLLTLARIESQQLERETGTLDLRGELPEAVQRFGPLCQGQGIALELAEPAAEPLTVRCDQESIREIVDNLMDNAIKYTPAGGRVCLGARRDGEQVEISVSDTGIGIEPRDQERVFERFYRVDKARSRELGGTGLGLAIVKHLALALGGAVSLESQPGRGSTFYVHLPRADAWQPAEAPSGL